MDIPKQECRIKDSNQEKIIAQILNLSVNQICFPLFHENLPNFFYKSRVDKLSEKMVILYNIYFKILKIFIF
ncbi:hypothetical protein MSTHT_0438 [Methanosarcina thermophila TM-1]|nr:hypothetical protein MSTHT_0438 [Methanosarcina thermophila TM-1]